MDEHLSDDLNRLNGPGEGKVRRIGSITLFEDKVIDHGGNGAVIYEGTQCGSKVAVRCVPKTPGLEFSDIWTNHFAVRSFSNILFVVICEEDDHHFYIASQYCAYNLYGMVKDDWAYAGLMRNNLYPSPEMLNLMEGAVAAVKHLQRLSIIHGNLNPSHLLFCQDPLIEFPGSFKLTGMSSSMRFPRDDDASSPVGTLGFQAPEQIIPGKRLTPATDVFGLGCLLFFFMTRGELPFGGDHVNNVINNNIVNLDLLDHIPEASDLIIRMLNPDPELRPKVSEVLRHPLFWDIHKRLEFLNEARITLRKKGEKSSSIVEALKRKSRAALSGSRAGIMDSEVASYIRPNYRDGVVQDLLRLIHKIEVTRPTLPPEIKTLLGSPMKKDIDHYFRLKFPALLMVVYEVMHLHCKEEKWFFEFSMALPPTL